MEKQIYKPEIIFINGIMPRSGTHFLANLLCHHPDCDRGVIPEDGLIERAALLKKYVERSHKRWLIEGDLPEIGAKELLYKSLGKGLTDFLRETKKAYHTKENLPVNNDAKYLVTKSPQTTNLLEFFKMFPEGKLLIIIRDGRSLVESIHTSFNYNREHAIRDWAEAADRIIEFEKYAKELKAQYLIIKYEELHSNTKNEMERILSFLNLNMECYDFETALNLPVVGSSVFKRGEGPVHWQPVTKTIEFKPLVRTINWRRKHHERFNWLAKKQLHYFGYQSQEFVTSIFYWKMRNHLLDSKYKVKLFFGEISTLFAFIKQRFHYFK